MQKKKRIHNLSGTDILKNFQTIEITKKLEPIPLQPLIEALSAKKSSETRSLTCFEEIDEKSHCPSTDKWKEAEKRKRVLRRFCLIVRRLIQQNRKMKEEELSKMRLSNMKREKEINDFVTRIHIDEQVEKKEEAQNKEVFSSSFLIYDASKQELSRLKKYSDQILTSRLIKILLLIFLHITINRGFNSLILALTLINTLVYCLFDFSFRIEKVNSEIKDRNQAIFCIELICNCFFGAEMILNLLTYGLYKNPRSYLRSTWNCVNFIIVLSSFLAYTDHEIVSEVFKVIRLTRVIKLIYLFPALKSMADCFVISILNSGNVIFNLLFFFILFSTLGLNLFEGFIEYRCREAPEPELIDNQMRWLVDEEQSYLCDQSQSNSCQENTYCHSALERNLPWNRSESDVESLNYGFSNFNNVLYAGVSGLNFLTFTGWSGINDIYWRTFSKPIVSFYSVFFLMLVYFSYFLLVIVNWQRAFTYYQSGIKTFASRKSKIAVHKEEKKIEATKMNQIISNVQSPIQSPFHKTHTKKENSLSSFNTKIKLTISKSSPKTQFLENQKFKTLICFLVVLNIVILILCYSFDPSSYISYVCEIIELVLTLVFGAEILFKLSFFGIKGFFRQNAFNLLDFMIILANVFEVIYEISIEDNLFEPKSLSSAAIKSLKFIRLFRFITDMDKWQTGSILFKETTNTLKKTSNFIILILIFDLLATLYGMQLFSYRVRLEGEKIAHDLQTGETPRLNYDTFLEAFLTTTLIFLNEEWHVIMFQYMRAFGSVATIYFVLVLIAGSVLLTKMFIALFINYFITSESIQELIYKASIWDRITEKIKVKMRKISFSPKRQSSSQFRKNSVSKFTTDGKELLTVNIEEVKLSPPQREKISDNIFKSNKNMQENNPHQTSPTKNDLEGKSFCIFDKNNMVRQLFYKVISNKRFEFFIVITIIISCVLLLMRDPFLDPESQYNQALIVTDYIVLVIYYFEILMKCVVYGFAFNGPESFMRKYYNFFDFVLLILTAIGTFDESMNFSKVNVKPFRVFRFLKIIYLVPASRHSMQILILSIPELFSVFFYFFLNLLFFGIIAMRYFRLTLFYCTSLDEEILEEVKDKWDCFDFGGDWVNQDTNYDNIFSAILSLFKFCTTEGWMNIMFMTWDFTGKDLQPIKNQHKLTAFFFIFYFIIANLVLMNMLIAVLVERFLREKNKNAPWFGLTEEQKEWAQIKELIYRHSPKTKKPTPKNKIRRFLHLMIKHIYFKIFSTTYTLLNGIIYMLFYQRQNQVFYDVLGYINLAFSCIFVLELIIRIIVLGRHFFKRFWNIYDFVIITISAVSFTYSFVVPDEGASFISFINVIELLRILRVIKKIPYLKKLFTVLYVVLPQVGNIAILLFTVILIYGVLGVELFAYLKPQSWVGGENIHFRNPFISMMNLVKCLTGESWYKQLEDCAREIQPNFICVQVSSFEDYQKYGLQGCGKPTEAHLYFISFILVVTLIILNLFVATILTTTEELTKIEELSVNRYQLIRIRTLWKEFDQEGTGFMSYKSFWRFASRIAIIFNVKSEDFLEIKNKKDFLQALHLPIYEKTGNKMFYYRFHDVVVTFAKVSVMLKYEVFDLEPVNPIPHLTKLEEESRKNKNFLLTQFSSGDMAKLMIIYNKIRRWLKRKKSLIYGDIADVHFHISKRNNTLHEKTRKIQSI